MKRSRTRFRVRLLAAVGLALILGGQADAQRGQKKESGENIAFPTAQGVYVVCGSTVASTAIRAADTVGYQVERRAGKGKWAVIATVEAVGTLAEFQARVGAERLKSMAKFLKLTTDDEVWNYVLANREIRKLPVMSDRAALRALGIVYLDTTVVSGTTYEYRVSTLLASNAAVKPRISRAVKAGELWTMASLQVSGYDETDSSVAIEWKAPRAEFLPATFHVFRRMSGAEDYREVPLPCTMSLRKDTLAAALEDQGLRRNQQYEYYLVPEDFWGNPAPPSQTAVAYTVNFTRLPLPQMLRAVQDSMGVRLSWKSYGKDYVVATRIYRSMDFDTGYVKIAEVSATDSSYLDMSASGMIRYYYRLTNVSYRNHESQTSATTFGFYRAMLGPAPPANVQGTPVAGGVEITWDANEEPDLAGYLVCRAVALSDSLMPVSPRLYGTRFTDTSAVLRGSSQYRYAVRAFNTSELSSDFSNEVRVRPKIATMPAAPRALYAYARPNGVALNWNDPREYDETVIGYALYRAEPKGGDAQFTLLAKLDKDPERTSYLDSTAVAGRRYLYGVASIDVFGSEGNRSMPAEAVIRRETPPPPADVHAAAIEGGIRVEWEAFERETEIASIVIYRQERGRQFEKLATVTLPAKEYIDKKIKEGTVYYYALSCVDKSGVEGARSRDVYAVP